MTPDTVVLAGGCHLWSGCGFPSPSLESFDFKPLFSIGSIDFNKPMLLCLISLVAVVAFFWFAFRKPQLVPRGIQNVAEAGYLFVRDQIARTELRKDEAERYLPFLISVFFFVWLMNIMEIVPVASFPVTAHIAFPAGLVLLVWVTYMYLGMKHQGPVKYFTTMMRPPGAPTWLLPLLAPLELISNVIVRPFTLAVRLFANMFAGHMLIITFAAATWYLYSLNLSLLFSATSFVLTVVLTAFELLIQVLQAYIFTLLAASYISGALRAQH